MESRNQMDQNGQDQSQTDILNEWGKFTGNQDMVKITNDRTVIQHVQNNSPVIKSIAAVISQTDRIDWTEVGASIGNNKIIKHLRLDFDSNHSDRKIQQLCRGLLLNETVEMLEVHCNGRRIFPIEALFEALVPFFSSNRNLQSLHVDLKETGNFPSRMKDAVLASSSLKSVSVKSCESWWRAGKLKRACDFIRAIFRKMEHVSLNGFLLPTNLCEEIADILRRQGTLKSLELERIATYNDKDVEIISGSVKENQSFKCLKITSAQFEVMEPFLLGMGNSAVEEKGQTNNCNIERLELQSGYPAVNLSVAAAVKQLPRLQSLRLDGLRFDEDIWKEILVSVLSPSSPLKELRAINCIQSDQHLTDLASILSKSHTLEVLNLWQCKNISTISWQRFFETATSLVELHLGNMSDTEMHLLSSFLATNQKLKVFTFHRYKTDENPPRGLNSLSSALNIHKGLEKIAFGTPPADSIAVDMFSALLENSNLKRVTMAVRGETQLRSLAGVVRSSNCPLNDMNIIFYGEGNAINQETELTQIAVYLLRNSSVKRFRFKCCGSPLFDFDWSQFSRLLCNNDSIERTFHSNHTLEHIEIDNDLVGTIPFDIYRLLWINQKTNKQASASAKIIECHDIVRLDFTMSTLPFLFFRLGDVNTNKALSMMYRIVRKTPEVVPQANKKFKIK